jgi:hypothetical protein
VDGEAKPVGVVTVTKYVPATVTPGETAVIRVEELTAMLVAGNSNVGVLCTPPLSSTNSTTAPVKNPVPLIVIDVPPAVEPEVGLVVL